VRSGLVISALTQREHLTEIVELPQDVHPWFMGVQFHPEFKSTPWDGHPLFNSFIHAACEHQAPTRSSTSSTRSSPPSPCRPTAPRFCVRGGPRPKCWKATGRRTAWSC
jgi:hypothetical protein